MILVSQNLKDWMPVIAAFVGALFAGIGAFLVTQQSAKIARNRKHWGKHRNALVYLEYRLNDVMCQTEDNRSHAKQIQQFEAREHDRIPITWVRPHALPDVASEYPELLRLELVNKCFSFQIKIRRHNNDIAQVCGAYAEMRSAEIMNHIDPTQHRLSLDEYAVNAGKLQEEYDIIDHHTMKLLARVRVSIRKDTLLDDSDFLTVPKCLPVTKSEVLKEIPILQEGITRVRAKSREELQEVLGKPPNGE